MGAKRARAVDNVPGDEIDGARTRQAGRDDQYQRHNDRRFVAEAVEGAVKGHGPERHADKKCREGDEIIAEPAPQQSDQHQRDQGEQDGLLVC